MPPKQQTFGKAELGCLRILSTTPLADDNIISTSQPFTNSYPTPGTVATLFPSGPDWLSASCCDLHGHVLVWSHCLSISPVSGDDAVKTCSSRDLARVAIRAHEEDSPPACSSESSQFTKIPTAAARIVTELRNPPTPSGPFNSLRITEVSDSRFCSLPPTRQMEVRLGPNPPIRRLGVVHGTPCPAGCGGVSVLFPGQKGVTFYGENPCLRGTVRAITDDGTDADASHLGVLLQVLTMHSVARRVSQPGIKLKIRNPVYSTFQRTPPWVPFSGSNKTQQTPRSVHNLTSPVLYSYITRIKVASACC
jgi:hypothetical protein